jgi:hypothetical protein
MLARLESGLSITRTEITPFFRNFPDPACGSLRRIGNALILGLVLCILFGAIRRENIAPQAGTCGCRIEISVTYPPP